MDDEAALAEYAATLADAIDDALPGWVVRCVTHVTQVQTGSAPAPQEMEAAHQAGQRALSDTGGRIRVLLLADVDQQKTTPLALLREAVRYPTEVLAQAGIAPVARDPFAAEAFPQDVYDLSPANFADIAPELAEPGLAWGAAKAFVHKRRHRSD